MCELKKFCGIIPAFYACYDDHGEINIEGVKKLVRYFIDKGVAGIYVNGSSGECIYQTVDERKKILETVMEEASGRIVVISHRLIIGNTEIIFQQVRSRVRCLVSVN